MSVPCKQLRLELEMMAFGILYLMPLFMRVVQVIYNIRSLKTGDLLFIKHLNTRQIYLFALHLIGSKIYYYCFVLIILFFIVMICLCYNLRGPVTRK